MNLKLKTILVVIGVIFFAHSFPTYADEITICSFNIQFLGISKSRDNNALTDILKDYDIVVIQEIVAPPYKGKFPKGGSYRPVPVVTEFFDLMWENGFKYVLSEEDTGPGITNHKNASSTEWWAVFYKDDVVYYADDLPHGFLEKDRTANKNYERVPYAFPFRTVSENLDFVLISVHLQPGAGSKNTKRRSHELKSIHKWIFKNNSSEKDFIILGDMNIEDKEELEDLNLKDYLSLNEDCVRTNTLINLNVNNGAMPYDHVMYNTVYTTDDIDLDYGFVVIDLVKVMKPYWTNNSTYPGNPYVHNEFRKYYSDHNPVVFKMIENNTDDD